MKYIKKFNESVSETYQEISKEYFSELVFGNRESYGYLIWTEGNPIDWKDFSDNELNKIHKVSKSRLFLDSEKKGWNYRVLRIGKYDRIKVIKLEDDWFLVEVSGSGSNYYYKCDQIEGLLKFLKDLYESE